MFEQIIKLKKFLGPDVVKYLFFSSIIGVFWFLVESSFIFMIQGFLLAIGLLNKSQVFLPDWYPTSLPTSIILLILFGLIRATAIMLKNHIGFLSQVSFASQKRAKLLELSLKNARLISSKEVVSLYTEIITHSGNVVSNLSLIINIGCSMLLFFISGIKIAPLEMFIGVGLLSIFLFPLKYLTRKISGLGGGLVEEWENVTGSLLMGLKNYFFLLIYNQIDNEIKKGKDGIDKYRIHYTKYSLIAGFASAFPMFIGIVILSLITFMSIKFIKTDPMKLISFFYLFIRFAQSAGEASTTISNLKLNIPSLKKLYRWTENLKSIDENLTRKKVKIDEKAIDIKLKNLSFGYEGRNSLLNDVNLSIGPSDILVIKGESGSGKSTLLSLILGLYVPTEGNVEINGLSSRTFDFDLHKVLAYVGPEPFMIQGTIRENLLYGYDSRLSIDEYVLWDALEAVELKTMVSGLKLQLNEPINDIPQLSTGQKQRLSFARALVRNPSLLILDEATANLDSQTEKKIISNLKEIFNSCTCIVVTHKNSFDAIATQKISLGGENYLKSSLTIS